jgi:hypothetical protein
MNASLTKDQAKTIWDLCMVAATPSADPDKFISLANRVNGGDMPGDISTWEVTQPTSWTIVETKDEYMERVNACETLKAFVAELRA